MNKWPRVKNYCQSVFQPLDAIPTCLDIVAITQTTELLLAGGVPHVEANGAAVGVERQRVHLHTQGGWKGAGGEIRV